MGCEWIGFCVLEQEAQAAWAQALLSVLAIGVAVYLPHKDRKASLRRHLDVYCALLSTLSDQASIDVKTLKRAIQTDGNAVRMTSGWDRLVKAVGDCPLHDVPDHRLVLLLTDATELAQVASDAWNRGSGGVIRPVREAALRDMQIAARALIEVADSAAKIRNELGSTTWIGAIRYRWYRWRKARRERREKAAKAKGNQPTGA